MRYRAWQICSPGTVLKHIGYKISEDAEAMESNIKRMFDDLRYRPWNTLLGELGKTEWFLPKQRLLKWIDQEIDVTYSDKVAWGKAKSGERNRVFVSS